MINSHFDISEQENFFPTYIASLVKNYILSQEVLWVYRNQVSYNKNTHAYITNSFDKNLSIKDAEAFTYLMDNKNNEIEQKIINQAKYFIENKFGIKVKDVLRAMLVHTPPDPMYPENHILSPHVDWLQISGYHNFLYYINDSDGPTLFFNKRYVVGQPFDTQNIKIFREIQPKQNKAIVFDGALYHAAGISRVKKRLTLNITYKPY